MSCLSYGGTSQVLIAPADSLRVSTSVLPTALEGAVRAGTSPGASYRWMQVTSPQPSNLNTQHSTLNPQPSTPQSWILNLYAEP